MQKYSQSDARFFVSQIRIPIKIEYEKVPNIYKPLFLLGMAKRY